MEEKILAKLETMENRFDSMEKKIDKMDIKFDELREEFKQENAKLKDELRNEFKQENAKLKDELRNEFKQESVKLKNKLRNELKSDMKEEILAQMFVFETEYGRNINIMYEEIMARNEKRNALEKNLNSLEIRVNRNSAFVFNHESRIATLEKTKR